MLPGSFVYTTRASKIYLQTNQDAALNMSRAFSQELNFGTDGLGFPAPEISISLFRRGFIKQGVKWGVCVPFLSCGLASSAGLLPASESLIL